MDTGGDVQPEQDDMGAGGVYAGAGQVREAREEDDGRAGAEGEGEVGVTGHINYLFPITLNNFQILSYKISA